MFKETAEKLTKEINTLTVECEAFKMKDFNFANHFWLKEEVSSQNDKLNSLQMERDDYSVVQTNLNKEISKITSERDLLATQNTSMLANISELGQQLSTHKDELSRLQHEYKGIVLQKQEASEETELILLQLHQVQEELEQYFLQARNADKLAEAQQNQLLRAKNLMAKVVPGVSSPAPETHCEVEVLPPHSAGNDVQKEALLNSYSDSLRRASILLQRAIRR